MSRTSDTYDGIEKLKNSIGINGIDRSTSYVLPALEQIALSLAVIADAMRDIKKDIHHG